MEIKVDNKIYARYPLKTPVIAAGDDLEAVIKKYAGPYFQKGDILFISEKIVAVAQGRAFPIKEIRPSWLARFLVRFVRKSPYGIGLGSSWTMHLAIREIGWLRILFAALFSALTKPLGIRGVFYLIAGRGAAAIDGPCSYTLPPYNNYAKLGPKNPNGAASNLRDEIGCEVVIIDANDLGVAVLGKSSRNISDQWAKAVFKDNPLGQTSEQTPLCIVRKVSDAVVLRGVAQSVKKQ